MAFHNQSKHVFQTFTDSCSEDMNVVEKLPLSTVAQCDGYLHSLLKLVLYFPLVLFYFQLQGQGGGIVCVYVLLHYFRKDNIRILSSECNYSHNQISSHFSFS